MKPEPEIKKQGVDDRYAYSRGFIGAEKSENYLRKFDKRIDRLRHEVESGILRKFAKGDCFDCSIGTGRFINKLPRATSYSGMDYSEDFVSYIRENYPGVPVKQGDLFEGIDEPDGKYDTVLSIRTLFALGDIAPIVSEMARISKNGGLIIFDYGVKPAKTTLDGNTEVVLSECSVSDVARTCNLDFVTTKNLDSPLVFGAIKGNASLGRLFASRKNFVPNLVWICLEHFFALFASQRKLYVLRKQVDN